MTTIPNEIDISARARMIARGLLATRRAAGIISMDRGNLRLKCSAGGYYWIDLDGRRLLRGMRASAFATRALVIVAVSRLISRRCGDSLMWQDTLAHA